MPKGFQKGNKLGGRTLGAKGKATLDKEARRAVFEQEVSDMFIATIKKARPEYLLDQFMGKATENVKVEGEITLKLDA